MSMIFAEEGNLIRHVKTDKIGVLVQQWNKGSNKGVVEVLINSRIERWFRSSCQVVS